MGLNLNVRKNESGLYYRSGYGLAAIQEIMLRSAQQFKKRHFNGRFGSNINNLGIIDGAGVG
jgi:hypothetical protein